MSSTWFTREDVTLAGRTWYLEAYDRVVGKKGQIEYLHLQVTVHTLPNRADTDADGLNDSEELNFGSDGYATDPCKAMCTSMRSATPSSRPDGRRAGRPSSQTRAASTWLPWSAQKEISRGRRRTASHVIINK
ncbi:MAG TPA: thrombospondin type 3 repeat-containing protein [Thermoplasmata archaeon]